MQLPKGNNLLHSGQILPRQPTHLHSHLLLLDFYFLMEQAKAKESASNRTTADNIVQTGQRTEKRRAATNSTYWQKGQTSKHLQKRSLSRRTFIFALQMATNILSLLLAFR
jgi:hypothetical protein